MNQKCGSVSEDVADMRVAFCMSSSWLRTLSLLLCFVFCALFLFCFVFFIRRAPLSLPVHQKHTLLMEHNDAVSALAVINGKLVSGSWDTNIKASLVSLAVCFVSDLFVVGLSYLLSISILLLLPRHQVIKCTGNAAPPRLLAPRPWCPRCPDLS